MQVIRIVLRLVGLSLFLGGVFVALYSGFALSHIAGEPAAWEMAAMTIAPLGIVGPLMVLGAHLAVWRWKAPQRSDRWFHILIWGMAVPGLLILPPFSLIAGGLASLFVGIGRADRG